MYTVFVKKSKNDQIIVIFKRTWFSERLTYGKVDFLLGPEICRRFGLNVFQIFAVRSNLDYLVSVHSRFEDRVNSEIDTFGNEEHLGHKIWGWFNR